MRTMNREFEEFFAYAKPILLHPIYRLQKHYSHHTRSLYDHSVLVAYCAFKMGKRLSLDVESIVRGALLHDFFLYDWHIEGKKHPKKLFKKHGFTHAKKSYINASFFFQLNVVEKDIILKHMFPLNIRSPLYIESWLVNVVDNIITFREYFFHRNGKPHSVLEEIDQRIKK